MYRLNGPIRKLEALDREAVKALDREAVKVREYKGRHFAIVRVRPHPVDARIHKTRSETSKILEILP